MRWVSRAHFHFFFLNLKTLVCSFHCITKGRNHYVEKAAVLGWKRVGVGDKDLIGGKEVEALLVGLVSGEAFAAAFLRIKGVIPRPACRK